MHWQKYHTFGQKSNTFGPKYYRKNIKRKGNQKPNKHIQDSIHCFLKINFLSYLVFQTLLSKRYCAEKYILPKQTNDSTYLLLLCFITLVASRNQRVPLAEQELLTLPEYLSSLPVFSGVRITRSLVLCVCFIYCCLSFVLFRLVIELSVLLRYTDSDYPFSVF